MWSSHGDAAHGFRVGIPDSWDVIVRDSPSFGADMDGVSRHSPELQGFFQRAMASNSELRLLAADSRSIAQGFAANVNVMSSDLGPSAGAPTLGELAQAKLIRLRKETAIPAGSVKGVDARLSGHPAARFDYALRAGDQDIAVRSYLLVFDLRGRRTRLELTMAAPGDPGNFDTIARSFAVTAR
jgi:hypothetical protein